MATIQKRESAKGTTYRIRVYDGQKQVTYNFKPDASWSESRTQKELNKAVIEFENKVKTGKVFDGEKLTFKKYCEEWLKEKKSLLSPTTYEYYNNVINNKFVDTLGSLKMSDIKPKHIKDYILNTKGSNGKELSPASVKKELAVLKSIFKTAWEDSIIDNNPTERVKPPKQEAKEKLKYFTLEQAQVFLNILDSPLVYTYKEHKSRNENTIFTVQQYKVNHTISTQFKLFFTLALMTGARKGEVLGLTWDDVDFNNGTITISKEVVLLNKEIIVKEPKTKTSIRSVVLPDSTIKLLKQYRKEWNEYKLIMGSAWEGEKFIFIQSNGKVMHPSTPYHKFIEIIENYNSTCENEKDKLPKIALHGLRHTSATLLISQNVDVKTVSKRLGHAQTSTTINIYSHSLEKQDRESAEKMDEMFRKSI